MGIIWRFPKMGVPHNHHPFSWDFPWNKPSVWGFPHWWKPPKWSKTLDLEEPKLPTSLWLGEYQWLQGPNHWRYHKSGLCKGISTHIPNKYGFTWLQCLLGSWNSHREQIPSIDLSSPKTLPGLLPLPRASNAAWNSGIPSMLPEGELRTPHPRVHCTWGWEMTQKKKNVGFNFPAEWLGSAHVSRTPTISTIYHLQH